MHVEAKAKWRKLHCKAFDDKKDSALKAGESVNIKSLFLRERGKERMFASKEKKCST